MSHPTPDWNTLTLGEALKRSAGRYPTAIAVIDGNTRTTFAELDRQADALALGLQDLGIARGDQVAVWLTNCTEWITSWVACARLGAVVVPINTRFKTEEVQYILKQSDAKALILMDSQWNIDYLAMAREMRPHLPALRSVIVWKDIKAEGMLSVAGVTAWGVDRLAQGKTLPPARTEDPVVIVYTSGTTGHPKGAMHNHIFLRNAANVARFMHVEHDDVVLGHMPFYHVAGCIATVGMCLLVGCTLVTLPQWVVSEALDVIERERVTIFGGIPTHFVDCLDEIRRKPRDTSCLKSAWIGGAPVTPDVALAAQKELSIKGLLASYGMTETTASTTLSEFEAPLEVLCDNKGKPVGEFELSIRDREGNALPVGETGELWVRGHIVMMGYYKNPQATAEVMTPDGWFRTGDLGNFDDQGYLKITSRLKDMFIVGGSNAYPAEIERMLQSHPKVKQAVVVGVPDRRLGEVGMAFVQLHEAAPDSEEELAAELTAYCRKNMADYKVPRSIRVVDDFPRTPTGKIQRFMVTAQAREALASSVAQVATA